MSAYELPPALRPYAEALSIVDAVPDSASAQWWPAGHSQGRRIPFAKHHHHPAVQGIHWDGAVPTYPCARLDLEHPALAGVADALRRRAAAFLGADGALYAFGMSHRSQRQCWQEAVETLASLVEDA